MSNPRRPWLRARTPEALGSAVRRLREVAALSQDELALRASTSRPTVSRLERGSAVGSSTLLDIAAACGYEVVVVPRGARITVEASPNDGEP
ncbi:helix-turn-helix domain-containing protein [Cellulosimicrobium cellulans]|uniref:helix-turn-helix domain-containing protein n=1 Tax=Cellulosimicrobium cellulans TaxID=1710 RepID=UPI00030D726F